MAVALRRHQRVMELRERARAGQPLHRGPAPAQAPANHCETLYVGNMAFGVLETDLRELFQSIGPVQAIRFVHDRQKGRFRGFGFVEIASDLADQAIARLNGRAFYGRLLVVRRADEGRRAGG